MSTSREPDVVVELQGLREAIAALSERVARLEDAGPLGADAPGPQTTVKRAARSSTAELAVAGSSVQLTRLAVISFVLCGALVLRTATNARWISPVLGVALGFAYCIGLLVTSQLLGRRTRSTHAVALGFCGALLPPLIALESVRAHTLPVAGAAALLSVSAIAALLVALGRRSPALATATLVATLAATIGIGLTADGVAWGAALVAAIGCAGLWLARREGWPFLRPVLLLPAALLLGVAVLVTARRPELPPLLPLWLLACAHALWLAVLVNTVTRLRHLDRFERALLPLASVWGFGVAALVAAGLARWAGAGLSVVALAGSAVALRRRRGHDERLAPFLVAAALLAALALPWVDVSGVALALFAVALQRVCFAAPTLVRLGHVLPEALVVAATVTAFGRAHLHRHGPPLALGLAATLAALSLLLYLRGTVARGRAAGHTAGIAPLACAVVTLFFTLSGLLARLAATRDSELLGQTVLVAALASAGVLIGRRRDLGAAALLGLLGIGLLAIKVFFFDLAALDGGRSVVAVAALGATALVSALAARRASG